MALFQYILPTIQLSKQKNKKTKQRKNKETKKVCVKEVGKARDGTGVNPSIPRPQTMYEINTRGNERTELRLECLEWNIV